MNSYTHSSKVWCCSILSQYPVPIAPKISILFTWHRLKFYMYLMNTVTHAPPIQSIIFWHALQSLYPVSCFCKIKCSLHETKMGFCMCLMNSLTHSAQIWYWKLSSWMPLDPVIKMHFAVRVSRVHRRLWTVWCIVLTRDTTDFFFCTFLQLVHIAPDISAMYRRQ